MTIYTVYKLKSNLNNFVFALEDCLFGAVKLNKNSDIDKYKYNGYRIGFDSRGGSFLFPDGSFAQNTVIFAADMSSSVHANNKTKNVLILGEGITQGLDDTSLPAEKNYSINFTATETKLCLSFHYNGTNIYLFVNGTEIIKSKTKDSGILRISIMLRKCFRRL